MKILIADDEALVRNGLKNSIRWEALGITQVLLADDGAAAVQLAEQHRPEIVLTDVRMPRMDGIALATRLRSLLPATRLIFMSGYSDKEYLKAAIQLKAVSYVEKPIDTKEVQAAVAEAVQLYQQQLSNTAAQDVRSRMQKAQLALALTQVNSQNEEDLRQAWNALALPPVGRLYLCTVLIQLSAGAGYDGMNALMEQLHTLHHAVQKRQMDFLYVNRSESHLLVQLFRPQELTRAQVDWFCRQLADQLPDDRSFFIAAGVPVHGLHQAPQSFQSAQKTLANGFFAQPNTVLLWQEAPADFAPISFESHITRFRDAVSTADYEAAMQQVESLYQALLQQRQGPVDAVKNAYYQFISILEWVATKRCIPFSAASRQQSAWQIVFESRTIGQLHQHFTQRMAEFIRLTEEEPAENELVFLMKDHIRKNYQRDQLSVQEVADAVHLSTAYACTLFKQETGTTINHFIVNYRIERAKQLLGDPRFRITNIASQLGFADSNYFGKCFKRLVGLSPSEYREKVSKWDG